MDWSWNLSSSVRSNVSYKEIKKSRVKLQLKTSSERINRKWLTNKKIYFRGTFFFGWNSRIRGQSACIFFIGPDGNKNQILNRRKTQVTTLMITHLCRTGKNKLVWKKKKRIYAWGWADLLQIISTTISSVVPMTDWLFSRHIRWQQWSTQRST